MRAKIQGYITQVLVDEGQYVTAGQPLFRLETNMLTENADAAKSGISAAQANVQASKAAVNAAQVEVNKLKPLVEKNIISNVQLQTAIANLAKAQAQLSQAIASQQQASANYKSVQANINYSIIKAPISGVVGKLPLKIGSLVGPTDATPLTTISDTRSVFAYFSLNEKEYLDFLEKSYGATVPEKIKNLPMVELKLANGRIYPEKGRIEVTTGPVSYTHLDVYKRQLKIESEIYQELIEFYGTLFNLPPLSAKIYAYLIFDFDKKGHTFDELLEVFCASKSSISSSINFLLNNNLIKTINKIDERKRYFIINDDFVKIRFEEILNRMKKEISIVEKIQKFSEQINQKTEKPTRFEIYREMLEKNRDNIENTLKKL